MKREPDCSIDRTQLAIIFLRAQPEWMDASAWGNRLIVPLFARDSPFVLVLFWKILI